MKTKLTLLPLVLSVALVAGCCSSGTASLKRVEIGMSKTQLLRVMGSPSAVAARGGVEYITYTLKGDDSGFGRPTVTFKIVGGAVESYGRIQPTPEFDAINGTK